MPYLLPSEYSPPRFLSNGHIQTIYASLVRSVDGVRYRRERLDTPDGDFIDLDWSEVGNGPIAILVHGLEGDASRPYMCGMTRALNRRGINVVALNLRGCSGEMNRRLVSYDLGDTADLDFVSTYVATSYPSRSQFLVGFSLGGNIVLKYVGELGAYVRPQIKKAVGFSVPCDMRSTAEIIHASSNRLYFRRFMRSIQYKVQVKHQMHPGKIPIEALQWPNSFREFDEYFTAPLLGDPSPEHYWERSSCKRVLSQIKIPSLMVNSKDDPLIGQGCYPVEIAAESAFLYFETPEYGGHVGFVSFNSEGEYWSEKRALSFLLDSK